MDRAPFLSNIADGPDGGQTWWLHASDGVRIRMGFWPTKAAKGTVLILPGRTEYIEKYGRTARQFAECGYATLSVDWRGQGLADRLLEDTMAGHVMHFSDYQLDFSAVIAAAEKLELPKPWHMLAHSMGGCIGLRALHEGAPIEAAVFSGPMWGIHMADMLRPVAWSLSWGSRHIGMGHMYAPGTAQGSYVLSEPFATNRLTCDEDMYQYMIDQLNAHPELGLGGPSMRWLHEALRETRDLSRMPSPNVPCLTVMGTDEDIVDPARVYLRMANWPNGRLELIAGGRHEVLMESQNMRTRVLKMICAFLNNPGGETVDFSSRATPAAVGGQGA
jgi:lysophospholipase